MFEIKHLKTMITLASTGNIRKTAEVLFTSQSALSHQIKDLELRLNAPLFIRNTSPVEFTETGSVLLTLAHDILPKIELANCELKKPRVAKTTLKIAIACHACFQWLLPVTSDFLQQNNDLDIEFIDDSFTQNVSRNTSNQQVSKLSEVDKASADILFTDEKLNTPNYLYQKIGQFEVVAVLPKEQQLNSKVITKLKYLTPFDFTQLTLLTYPLATDRLDIFKLFLTPAGITPKKVKQVNNSHVMLQMVAANMGVATLPDWLVTSLTQQSILQTLPLGQSGIYKNLYACYQKNSTHKERIEQLIPAAKQAFSALYTQATSK
ncbi:MAG: LysR family transcriptional regulator [Colwellia sp.]|nr:LysR family transcriptional regulator [Colwellia sp.]